MSNGVYEMEQEAERACLLIAGIEGWGSAPGKEEIYKAGFRAGWTIASAPAPAPGKPGPLPPRRWELVRSYSELHANAAIGPEIGATERVPVIPLEEHEQLLRAEREERDEAIGLLERVVAGFSGMFGSQGKTPLEDGQEWVIENVQPFLARVEAKEKP